MPATELEQVLSNWINQAISPPGQFAQGVDPAHWVAQRFIQWWSKVVDSPLSDAEHAMNSLHSKLEQFGGWSNAQLGEAMHEFVHLKDALADLRAALGLTIGQ